MTWIEYRYSEFRKDNGVVKKPVLEIEISYNSKTTRQLAIVDSGADMTLISSDIAKLLRINTDDLEKTDIGGIMGSTPHGRICELGITVARFEDEPCTVTAVFVPELRSNVLLGQEGFFDNFRVQFLKDIDVFKLSRVQREPPAENLA